MNALLLGLHQSNGNVSIDNYFNYCRAELPRFLPGWDFSAIRPGESSKHGTAPQESLEALPSHPNLPPPVPAQTIPAHNGQTWTRVENYVAWPLRLTSLRADVFHVVDQNIAWYLPFLFGGQTIVTVHDLIKVMVIRKHLSLAEVPRAQAAKIKFCAEQLQKAAALVCVSQNTADCAIRELGVPASKIHVVYNMIPSEFSAICEREKFAARQAYFGDTEVALLHVGKPSIYKNREGVLRIFERVKKRYPSCRLVVTNTQLSPEELAVLEDPSSAASISLQQPATRRELRLLYGAADVFLFPSLYEGFGWPPVEAMACGCPVVSSTSGSLAEVVGEGAVTITDAHDHVAFADAVVRLVQDASLTRQMVNRGFQNASRFASDIVTPQLAQVYCSVC